MAIDFNKQLVFDPKIEIVGEEIPLAEMEKTGQVLQGRYDKSYEDYSTFKELAKQTEQISDPEEREKVKQYIKDLEPQVKQIGEKGDFHNMRQQTAALAKNAAFNLKLFGERAAEAKKYRDLISANDKLGDEETKAYYQNKLNKVLAETQYNPETKSFNFSALQLPKMVEDYDSNKFLQNVTQGWMANRYGSESANMAFLKAGDKIPGVGGVAPAAGVYNTKTGRQDTTVDFNEVYNNALKAAEGERGLQAMLKRDFEIQSENKNLKPEEQEVLKESLKRKYLYDPLTGFSNKAAYALTDLKEDVGYDVGASNAAAAAAGANKPQFGGDYSPADVFQEHKKSSGDFKKLTFDAIEGNKASKSMVLGALDAMSNINPKAKEAKIAVKSLLEFTKKYPQYADNISKATAGQTNLPVLGAAQGVYNILNMGFNLVSDAIQGNSTEEMRKDFMKVKNAYGKVASTDFIDSEFEDQFQQFAKSAPMTRTLPLKEFDIRNDDTRNLLDNLAKKYTKDDFDIIEGGEWKNDNKNVEFMRWSDEPYGAGTGMVLEVKDNKGNTFLVQPKKQSLDGVVGQIAKANPQSNIKRTYDYKDLIPVSYNNATKSFADFAEEVDRPQVKAALNQYKDYTIQLKDGTYYLFAPNEKEPRLTSTSMYDLLPSF